MLRRICLIGSVVVALVAGSASAASAAVPAGSWGGATCATGSLTGFEMAEGNRYLVILGSSARCDGQSTAATFGVVFFRPADDYGRIRRSGIRNYPSGGQARGFGIQGPTGGTWGACLMSDPATRVDCVVLTAVTGWSFRHVPADDPLVDKPALPYLTKEETDGWPTDPNCGGCW